MGKKLVKNSMEESVCVLKLDSFNGVLHEGFDTFTQTLSSMSFSLHAILLFLTHHLLCIEFLLFYCFLEIKRDLLIMKREVQTPQRRDKEKESTEPPQQKSNQKPKPPIITLKAKTTLNQHQNPQNPTKPTKQFSLRSSTRP